MQRERNLLSKIASVEWLYTVQYFHAGAGRTTLDDVSVDASCRLRQNTALRGRCYRDRQTDGQTDKAHTSFRDADTRRNVGST